jgi:methylglutamate dehydrogenase subunit B
MRITCTYCGSRDVSEFSYLGDATLSRPAGGEGPAMHDYVYLRDNPAGPHEELWYHAQGCRSWLRVRRDTISHEILDVRMAVDK